MDFPLYTTLKMSLFHFFLFKIVSYFCSKENCYFSSFSHFPQDIDLAYTWGVKDRDWEGAIQEPEHQGRQKSLEGCGDTRREESFCCTSKWRCEQRGRRVLGDCPSPLPAPLFNGENARGEIEKIETLKRDVCVCLRETLSSTVCASGFLAGYDRGHFSTGRWSPPASGVWPWKMPYPQSVTGCIPGLPPSTDTPASFTVTLPSSAPTGAPGSLAPSPDWIRKMGHFHGSFSQGTTQWYSDHTEPL